MYFVLLITFRINALKALSENGKDISYFEEEIG